MNRRLRRAYTSLVEQGYAKLAAVRCRSRLDLIITKATSPDDLPLPDRYAWELATAFTSSPPLSLQFAIGFTRRFGRTKSWRVALKCLLLLHLLLQTLPSNHPFRTHILSARANALLSFHPCSFRDASSSHSEEYTAFIRSYAHLINEVLNSPPLSPPETVDEKLREAEQALELVQWLQRLTERAMECAPAGPAARSPVIRSAMKQVAREGFTSYLAARRGLTVVLDGILQMPYRSCVEGLGAYRRAAEQAVRLGEFHRWCEGMGFCARHEYPLVEEIPKVQVLMLENFVEQVWQLPGSSSASSAATSEGASPAAEAHGKGIVISQEWERFEDESGEEEKPLIKLEDDGISWEVLLDSSLQWPWKNWCREDDGGKLRYDKDDEGLQLFDPHFVNPFFFK